MLGTLSVLSMLGASVTVELSFAELAELQTIVELLELLASNSLSFSLLLNILSPIRTSNTLIMMEEKTMFMFARWVGRGIRRKKTGRGPT